MPADPDAAPEAVERMVTAPCPRCGTIHLWDQDPRAADAAEVERLTSENARLREALAQAVVDLDACRMINEAGGIGKAYGLRSTLAKARTALGGAHE